MAAVVLVPLTAFGLGFAYLLGRTGSDSTRLRDASGELPSNALRTVHEMCAPERFEITAVTPEPSEPNLFTVECSYLPWGVPAPREIQVVCSAGEWITQRDLSFVDERSSWEGVGLPC